MDAPSLTIKIGSKSLLLQALGSGSTNPHEHFDCTTKSLFTGHETPLFSSRIDILATILVNFLSVFKFSLRFKPFQPKKPEVKVQISYFLYENMSVLNPF